MPRQLSDPQHKLFYIYLCSGPLCSIIFPCWPILDFGSDCLNPKSMPSVLMNYVSFAFRKIKSIYYYIQIKYFSKKASFYCLSILYKIKTKYIVRELGLSNSWKRIYLNSKLYQWNFFVFKQIILDSEFVNSKNRGISSTTVNHEPWMKNTMDSFSCERSSSISFNLWCKSVSSSQHANLPFTF